MRTLILLLILPALCLTSFAQSAPDTPILTLGLYTGPGSRALGLGGAYTGVADDFTATYWNPAGISQIKRIELQGSLLQTGYSNSTRYQTTPLDVSSNFTHLNNLGMVFPVPVYQALSRLPSATIRSWISVRGQAGRIIPDCTIVILKHNPGVN